MKASEVQAVLLRRTAMFLALRGKSLEDAVELGWLDPKHRKNPEFQRLVGGSLPTTRKKRQRGLGGFSHERLP